LANLSSLIGHRPHEVFPFFGVCLSTVVIRLNSLSFISHSRRSSRKAFSLQSKVEKVMAEQVAAKVAVSLSDDSKRAVDDVENEPLLEANLARSLPQGLVKGIPDEVQEAILNLLDVCKE
jgi:hypothetical protein